MHREKVVCIEVFSYGHFKFFLLILQGCLTRWQTDEKFDDSIKCTFLETSYFGTWSLQIVLIPCINNVYK
jgi:hypothetical protein